MTDPEFGLPLYERSVPCKNSRRRWPGDSLVPEECYVDNDGRCAECKQKVPHDRLGPKEPNRYTRVAHPHDRSALGYVVEDPVSCSCGGWYGTPIGRDRVDSGAELLLLSFQQRVDDIDHNVENLVSLILEMKVQLDRLTDEDQQ